VFNKGVHLLVKGILK